MFLVQSWFDDETSWRTISELVEKTLGPHDGLESLLAGPPLVGAFEGPILPNDVPPHDA
jgi:hypothetical protein